MRGFRHWTHTLPAELSRQLMLAPGERPLGWGTCGGGCSLVATAHGLWECSSSGPAVRHCWQATEVRCVGDTMEVRSGPSGDPICPHVMESSSRLPELVRAMDSGSRLVELTFRLPSGTTVLLQARSCRYESTIVWTSRSGGSKVSDAASDTVLADQLLQRARQEFGTTGSRRHTSALVPSRAQAQC